MYNNIGKNEDRILICVNEGESNRLQVITVPVILVASPNCLAFPTVYHPHPVVFCFVN